MQNDYAVALVRSEAYFKAIIDTALDAIITTDHRGRIEIFNSAAERLLGYALSEVLGHNVSMLMTDKDRQHHELHLRPFLETENPKVKGSGREALARHKDGSSIPVHLSVARVRAPGQRSYAVMIRDLSSQKEAEAASHREHERLTTVIEQAPMGIVIRHVGGALVTVNEAFCNITGYSEREFREMVRGEITHPDDRAMSSALIARVEAGEISRYSERKRYLRKDGTVLHVRVVSAVTRDLNGQAEFFISEVEDLSPRLRAEADARDSREQMAHVDRLNTLGKL